MTKEGFFVPRPSLTFRVGVTGLRKLPPAELPRIRQEIRSVLMRVRDETGRLARDQRGVKIYAPCPGGGPLLRLVSPLAEGADRRVAEEALELGYRLYAPLPFKQEVYERDFPETIAIFRGLLNKGEKIELDGEIGNFASDSYREVGRFVVQNSDLLIALWDGARENGPGGTAEIARYALATHVPVWRIDPTGPSQPAFLDKPIKLRRGGVTGAAAEEKLTEYLSTTLLPPALAHGKRRGFFAALAHGSAQVFFRPPLSPLEEFLEEKPPVRRFVWRAYDRMTWLFSAPTRHEAQSHTRPAAEAEAWWDAHYRAADRLAIGQGDRYRSSYVWIALSAFAAISSGALAFVMPEAEYFLIGAEITALLVIVFIVTASHLHRWHEKWISYRLLAELCRKQYLLSSVGRGVPAPEALRAAHSSDAPRDIWVVWWFAALQRAAPFPKGSLDAAGARDLALSLVTEQILYHRNCEARCEAAAGWLAGLGEWLFLAAAGLTAAKTWALLEHQENLVNWNGALAICVSAASASFVGVRAYSEFALLARESEHMRRLLTLAEADLHAIDLETPLAARELGRTLYAVALLMLQDVGGWARLFRMKTLEAA